ncbi:signal recognition particle-docking protein FtsY, partial [Hoeflea prorocentri]|nr:signal recognition particle-docking protein FtsY [Hoeflea prorocentri]
MALGFIKKVFSFGKKKVVSDEETEAEGQTQEVLAEQSPPAGDIAPPVEEPPLEEAPQQFI